MKKQNKKNATIEKKDTKRTPLDNFQLFYEEIPLEVKTAQKDSKNSSNDRLSRRSRQ